MQKYHDLQYFTSVIMHHNANSMTYIWPRCPKMGVWVTYIHTIVPPNLKFLSSSILYWWDEQTDRWMGAVPFRNTAHSTARDGREEGSKLHRSNRLIQIRPGLPKTFWLLMRMFYRLDALPVSQPTVSKQKPQTC